MRIIRAAASIVLVLALSAGSSRAATKSVAVGDRFFDPVRVKVGVGDSVHWSGSGSQGHNVRQDDKMFYSGPRVQTVDFTVVFSAGTWHYFCETHGTRRGGMDGFVKVPVDVAAAPSGAPFTVKWATGASQTGRSYDVSYRIASGKWTGWKKGVDANRAVFGRNGAPVNVDPGTKYHFRARSKGGGDRSDWSPVRSFTP